MEKILNYSKTIDDNINWIIEEKEFVSENQSKFESIFSFGNSYLGLRAVTEEDNLYRHYGLFIGGTFNLPSGDEVPELPNGADILNMEFKVNGIQFNMTKGNISQYTRYFNYQDAILIREFIWTYEKLKLKFKFQTFLSWENIHLIAQKVEVVSLNGDVELDFISGIYGHTSNTGVNHFEDTDTQFHQDTQQYIFRTIQSKIDFYYSRTYKFILGNKVIAKPKNSLLSVYGYDRKKVYQEFNFELPKNKIFTIESYTMVNTSNDFDFKVSKDFLKVQLSNILTSKKDGFDKLFHKHKETYQKEFNKFGVSIKSKNKQDELILRASIYHMIKFTPRFDKRLNVDAKGWTGEEYKGHTFWDTEIYILPFYIYTNPEQARKLLEHRYFVKNSAHIKAQDNNFLGAMWPWETSWVDDGETCPTWGEVDFKTGKRMKVWAGFNELHISVDIMWAIWLYFNQTNDQEFMDKYGYEMLFDTAIFWMSKVIKNKNNQYEILNVTGPNEYKEDINNNYFTNFMVKEMLNFTVTSFNELEKNHSNLLTQIDKKIKIKKHITQIAKIQKDIFLPEQENGIIPENDTFLKLKNLEKIKYYKEHRGEIWKEYTSNDLNSYQLLKQADIIALFYTLSQKFDKETIIKNWQYYESRTLHTSSLSHSMHATTAARIGENELAYQFFQKALAVDFGTNMGSSTNGIHTAATGGVIKTIVEGFAGLQNDGQLHLNPNLPNEIEAIAFHFTYCQQEFFVQIVAKKVNIKKLKGNKTAKILIHGTSYDLPIVNKTLEVGYD